MLRMSGSTNYRLGFIGCGNMAQAIAAGAIKANILAADRVIASDPTDAHRALFEQWGCATSADNAAVIRGAEQIVLAVKPQIFPKVAPQLADLLDDSQVLISIMAGVSSRKIAELLGKPARVIRVMPNTPAMVGQGMAGLALCGSAQPGDDALAMQLFAAVGKTLRLEEHEIDRINAVSGSGPGYVFYFAEAMEKAAAELGLGEHARMIVGQTLLGSAKLLVESGESPQELRRKVTSPGGTTQAACELMDEKGVMDAIVAAMHAAERRAKELGG